VITLLFQSGHEVTEPVAIEGAEVNALNLSPKELVNAALPL